MQTPPDIIYTGSHIQSEHDFDPNDVHYGDISAYFNGQVSNYEPQIGPLVVVNPAESPPTGWGAPNEQQFQTGHTQNVPTNESMEQGRGVGPERAWPHYPHATNPNPFRALNVFQRSGTDDYSNQVYRAEAAAYWVQGIVDSLQHQSQKQRSPVNPIVNQFPTQPYTSYVQPLVDW